MRLILIIILLISSLKGFSQLIRKDTAFVALADARETQLYNDFIGGQSRLYNGTEYHDYLTKDEEHPYFGANDWSKGNIVYDDDFYKNIELFYDISRDQVITEHKLTGGKIEMIAKKIAQFTINGHPFVRLNQDKEKVIKEGFYEVLYQGKVNVFARREKQMQDKTENYTVVHTFIERNKVYIVKNGIYHFVKTKKSVLAVFDDKRQELKAFLKTEKLRYKDNRELAIAKMAGEYDKQTN
ncbi:MAG: hypothetical protein ABIS36_02990 [Chryseolinea sp.]